MLIYPSSAAVHVVVGAVSGLSVLSVILYTEPEVCSYLQTAIKRKLGKSE